MSSGHTDPEWWFESQGIEYWLGEILNTPLEVHTLQLGLFVGVLFAITIVRHYPRLGAVGFAGLLLFLFGGVDIPIVCSTRTEACAHALLKPWYFLSGVVVGLGGFAGLSRAVDLASGTELLGGNDGYRER